MEEKKKFDWKNIVILAMLASLVFCLFKIGELSSQYENLSSSQDINYNILRGDIDNIYSNVDKKLQKDASLFSGVDYSIGELSVDKMTAPLKVSVVPKVISDDMRLSVTVDGHTSDLTKKGSTFEGTVDVGLFIDYDKSPLLTVETKDGVKTEYLEDIGVSHLFMQFLPSVFANASGTTSPAVDFVQIDLDFTIETMPPSSDSNSKERITSYKLVKEVNGKVEERKDITMEVIRSEEGIFATLSQSFSVLATDRLNVYVEAEDSLGFIHKTLVYVRSENEYGDAVETTDCSEHIYDKDGKLLFGEKF